MELVSASPGRSPPRRGAVGVGRSVHRIFGFSPVAQVPKVRRASSSFRRSCSARSPDCASRSASSRKSFLWFSRAASPASTRSTITRLALVRCAVASDRTRWATDAGRLTLRRTGFSVLAMQLRERVLAGIPSRDARRSRTPPARKQADSRKRFLSILPPSGRTPAPTASPSRPTTGWPAAGTPTWARRPRPSPTGSAGWRQPPAWAWPTRSGSCGSSLPPSDCAP